MTSNGLTKPQEEVITKSLSYDPPDKWGRVKVFHFGVQGRTINTLIEAGYVRKGFVREDIADIENAIQFLVSKATVYLLEHDPTVEGYKVATGTWRDAYAELGKAYDLFKSTRQPEYYLTDKALQEFAMKSGA